MKRLMEETVFFGLTMAWRLANWPTRVSPDSVNPTTDGVRFDPCLLGMTLTSLPSITATTEFVVPRSMPTILPMVASAFLRRESPQVELRWIESKNSLAETVGEG